MTEQMKNSIKDVVKKAKVAFVSYVEENGYPAVGAMFTFECGDLFNHYFSTKLSSNRARQFLKNPKASVYFCDETGGAGVRLTGEMQVMCDREHKAKLWRAGFEIYYPDGVDTWDYCVLRFIADRGNYYNNLENRNFTRKDFENA